MDKISKNKKEYLALVERHGRAKINAKAKKWRDNNQEKVAAYGIKKHYGLSIDEYEEMLLLQNGVCAICNSKETHFVKSKNDVRRLAVDHCHVSGKIRGLLCTNCNKGLAAYHDNIALFENAIMYLKKNKT